MSSTGFQRYVEAMNRQTLDKRIENQGINVILPHQRTRPTEEYLGSQKSGLQPPKDKTQFTKDSAQQQFTPRTPAYVSVDAVRLAGECLSLEDSQLLSGPQPKPTEYQLAGSGTRQNHSYVCPQKDQKHSSAHKVDAVKASPGISHGLAKSRWADPSYDGTLASKLDRCPSILSNPLKNWQNRKSDGRVADTLDQSIDTSPHCSSSVDNKISSPKREAQIPGFDPSVHQNLKESGHAEAGGWDELGGAGTQTQGLGLQPPSATRAGLKPNIAVDTCPTEIKEIKSGEQKCNNLVPDPRGYWPDDVYTSGGVDQDAAKQDWDQTSRVQTKSSNGISSSEGGEKIASRHMIDFIKIWAQGAHTVEADFLLQNADPRGDCDVDTDEGVLMKPVDYPETTPQELMSRAQLEGTSTLSMREFEIEMRRRNPKTKALRMGEKQAKVVADRQEAGHMIEDPPNPNEVRIPCHLRPASESDIEAITAIYNEEVAEGHKVMDIKPVEQGDFRRIYNYCRTEKMPFIVAVEGWYETEDLAHPKIIGFSLVAAAYQGIAGSWDTRSQPGGKLLVVVKPEYRRKKIGTALIDIIITNCTGWYISKRGYQFINYTHPWLSTEFGNSTRKWWYLEMDVMVRSGANKRESQKSEEFQWIRNFLEFKFDLLLNHHDNKCCLDSGRNWLDKLTFRRDCRIVE